MESVPSWRWCHCSPCRLLAALRTSHERLRRSGPNGRLRCGRDAGLKLDPAAFNYPLPCGSPASYSGYPSRWIPCILLGWGVGGAYWSFFNVRPPGEASAPWRFI